MIKLLKIALFILIAEVAGLIGSFFTTPSIATWYASLNKPRFNPPNWIFAPVWTTLFLLMGVAAYLIYAKGLKKKNVQQALAIFALQLIFNVFWSIIFFGLHLPLLALIEIVFLWGLILLTINKFYKIAKPAAYLLIPYLLWVAFATVLNLSIVILN